MEIYILGSIIVMILLVLLGIIETVRGTAEEFNLSDVFIFLGLAICSWGGVTLVVILVFKHYILTKEIK